MKRPIGIDLFAGAGGLSLGFEQAGFEIAAAVEIDPVHAAAHAYNFPRCSTMCRSVTAVAAPEIRAAAGIGASDIGVVFGGAPCQGFSMIGKRALDDPRNGLVYHFVRLVLELRPRYFVFENVKGLTLGAHKQFLEEIVQAFQEGGYRVLLPYRVLNAADYGVPQDRRRLFLIGARGDEKLPKYPQPLLNRVTVEEAIGDIPDADAFDELLTGDSVRTDYDTASAYARTLKGLTNEPTDFGYRRAFDRAFLTSSMRAEHTALSRRRFAQTEHGKTEPISRFHKLNPKGVCNTLRSGTNTDRGAFTSPRPIHYKYARCITVREAARLHSYPDWFRFHVTKWHGFRQIGNSVPPRLARSVAAQIMSASGTRPSVPEEILSLGDIRLLSFAMVNAAAHWGVASDVIPKRVRGMREEQAVYA